MVLIFPFWIVALVGPVFFYLYHGLDPRLPGECMPEEREERIIGWVNLSKSGKAILVKPACGHMFSVPVSMLNKLLAEEIKGIPIREYKR